ncbi:hypothetical protein, variant 2 [Aphanomyces astaci]|uniref:Fungal lipase-type domain-containing protein n=1 Tax=Aphanomyces astaci TaxID=112090 RepID=W4GYG2_APHAT|nr:hypothetical protein, variant 2 [Aphanomyces astaci]ETV83968.1 hypothetical protein, variant 2 [Aphanomyces astaci]|eukprot:XP_009825661.1 hypothetical protein, variant 2 [Aphanomyces astaci]
MLRHAAAVRHRLTQTLASPQPLQRDPLSILKTIADAVPSSLMKMTSADWLLRLTVMARHNSSRPPSTTQSPSTLRGVLQSSMKLEESAFLKELQYYVRVCDAVYASTQERFMKDSLLADSNVTIVQSHQGGVFAPKYYVYVDHDIQTIVLVIRGSASIQDFVTDMCMHHEPFQTGYGHRGIVHAANWLDWKLRDDMIKLAATHPTYDVRLTGHSLGAGAAALLAHLWSPVIPRMHCLVFAPPACLTLDLAQTCRGHVTSVILGDDCVPRLSGANLVALLDEVEHFEMSSALKTMVTEELQAKAKQTEQSAGVRHIRHALGRVERLKQTASQNWTTKLSSISPPSVDTLSWLQDKPFATELKQLWKQLDKRGDETTLKRVDKGSWLEDKPFVQELKMLWEQVDSHLGRTQQFLSLDPTQWPRVSAWPFQVTAQEQFEWRQRMDFVSSMPNNSSSKKLMSLWGKLDVNVVAIEGLLRFVNDPERKRQLVGQIEGLLREISTTRSMFTNLAPVLDPMSNRLYELLMATKHTLEKTNVVIPMTNNFKSPANIDPAKEPKPTASSPVLQNKILSMVDGICAELRREIDSILELGKSSVGDNQANQRQVDDELQGMAPVFPPGNIVVLDTSGAHPALTQVSDVNTYFNRIIVSNDMIGDHLSSTYDDVIRSMLQVREEQGKDHSTFKAE